MYFKEQSEKKAKKHDWPIQELCNQQTKDMDKVIFM